MLKNQKKYPLYLNYSEHPRRGDILPPLPPDLDRFLGQEEAQLYLSNLEHCRSEQFWGAACGLDFGLKFSYVIGWDTQ